MDELADRDASVAVFAGVCLRDGMRHDGRSAELPGSLVRRRLRQRDGRHGPSARLLRKLDNDVVFALLRESGLRSSGGSYRCAQRFDATRFLERCASRSRSCILRAGRDCPPAAGARTAALPGRYSRFAAYHSPRLAEHLSTDDMPNAAWRSAWLRAPLVGALSGRHSPPGGA